VARPDLGDTIRICVHGNYLIGVSINALLDRCSLVQAVWFGALAIRAIPTLL